MSAILQIQIYSSTCDRKQEVEFFNAADWTIESEMQLIQRLHELLAMIRPLGKSIKLNLTADVSDSDTALFIINKKLTKGCEINAQKLTIREIEILGLIMQGLTNNEIAEKLFISYETVKSHRKNILEKTGAKNTAALINHYHQTFFEK